MKVHNTITVISMLIHGTKSFLTLNDRRIAPFVGTNTASSTPKLSDRPTCTCTSTTTKHVTTTLNSAVTRYCATVEDKEKICVILELTFIEACLQIATGNVDVLKLFIAALKEAYDKRIPIPELVETLESMDTIRHSANRKLTTEEVCLRTLWLNVSYLTLEYLERIENGKAELEFDSNIDEALEQTLSVSMQTRGTYKFIVEEKVKQFLGLDDKTVMVDSLNLGMEKNTAQAAMMSYTLRIIDKTLKVVREERMTQQQNERFEESSQKQSSLSNSSMSGNRYGVSSMNANNRVSSRPKVTNANDGLDLFQRTVNSWNDYGIEPKTDGSNTKPYNLVQGVTNPPTPQTQNSNNASFDFDVIQKNIQSWNENGLGAMATSNNANTANPTQGMTNQPTPQTQNNNDANEGLDLFQRTVNSWNDYGLGPKTSGSNTNPVNPVHGTTNPPTAQTQNSNNASFDFDAIQKNIQSWNENGLGAMATGSSVGTANPPQGMTNQPTPQTQNSNNASFDFDVIQKNIQSWNANGLGALATGSSVGTANPVQESTKPQRDEKPPVDFVAVKNNIQTWNDNGLGAMAIGTSTNVANSVPHTVSSEPIAPFQEHQTIRTPSNQSPITQGDSFQKGLSKEKLCMILELTFIDSCLEIATGNVAVLKLFIETIKIAYDKRIPIPELVDTLEDMDAMRNSANRKLTSEEICLRTLWLNLSYLTLEYLERIEGGKAQIAFDSNMDAALEESLAVSILTRGTYKFIVEEKVRQFLGLDVKTSHVANLNLGMEENISEAAMMAYSLKIIDKTLKVVWEERMAQDPITVNYTPPPPQQLLPQTNIYNNHGTIPGVEHKNVPVNPLETGGGQESNTNTYQSVTPLAFESTIPSSTSEGSQDGLPASSSSTRTTTTTSKSSVDKSWQQYMDRL